MTVQRFIQHISLGIFLSCMSSGLLASPAKMSSVKQLMQVSQINTLLNDALDELKPYYDKQSEQILLNITRNSSLTADEQQAAQKLSALMKISSARIISSPKTQQAIEKIYLDNYTEQEVQASLRFLSTPEGLSISRKNAKMMGQISEYMMQLGEQMYEDPAIRDTFQNDMLTILQPIIQKYASAAQPKN